MGCHNEASTLDFCLDAQFMLVHEDLDFISYKERADALLPLDDSNCQLTNLTLQTGSQMACKIRFSNKTEKDSSMSGSCCRW